MSFQRDAPAVLYDGADLAGSLIFFIANLSSFVRVHPRRGKQKAIQSSEIAVDTKILDMLLDTVDGSLLARLKTPRQLLAAYLDEFAQPVVADRREMGSGAGRHAAQQ
jgi:hypothetical protein